MPEPITPETTTEASTDTTVTETETTTTTEPEATDATTVSQPVEDDELSKLKADVENWRKRSRGHEDNVKALVAEKTNWTKARQDFEAKLSQTTTALEEKSAQLQLITIQAVKTKLATEYKLPEPALKLLTATDEDGLKAQAIATAEAIAAVNPGFAKPQPLTMRNQGQSNTGASANPARDAMALWERENRKK